MTDLVQKFRKRASDLANPNMCWGNYVIRKWLSEAADEIEFMREILQDHGRTLPHGKDECDWCSRELKETP